VVDWLDRVYWDKADWDPFYDYFRIGGAAPKIPKDYLLLGLKEPHPQSVWPEIWKGKLDQPCYSFYKKGNYGKEGKLRESLGYCNSIAEYLKRKEDIVVLTRCHGRKSEFIKQIGFSDEINDLAERAAMDLFPCPPGSAPADKPGSFCAMTVRYTDKAMPPAQLDSYFNRATEKIDELTGPKRIFLATDSIVARNRAVELLGPRVKFLDRWLDPQGGKNHHNPACPSAKQRFIDTLVEMKLLGSALYTVHYDGYTLFGHGSCKSSYATAALAMGSCKEIVIKKTTT